MNAPRILTRLLAGAAVAGMVTLTVFSGSASAQMYPRSATPGSQSQAHDAANRGDGVIGHGAGIDSTIESNIQAGVGSPPGSNIQAGECGFFTQGWDAYYRHCASTNAPIYVEFAWGPDRRLCVGPWTTTNLSDHPAMQGGGWITGARWSGWNWC